MPDTRRHSAGDQDRTPREAIDARHTPRRGKASARQDRRRCRSFLEKAALEVSALCDAYLADAKAGRLLTRRRTAKKASTLAADTRRVERHIKPLLGKLKVAAVTRDDIEAFMHGVAGGRTAVHEKTSKRGGVSNVRGGKGTASRTVGLLGSIFTYAVRKKLRPDNPVKGVVKFADKKRERRLGSLSIVYPNAMPSLPRKVERETIVDLWCNEGDPRPLGDEFQKKVKPTEPGCGLICSDPAARHQNQAIRVVLCPFKRTENRPAVDGFF